MLLLLLLSHVLYICMCTTGRTVSCYSDVMLQVGAFCFTTRCPYISIQKLAIFYQNVPYNPIMAG